MIQSAHLILSTNLEGPLYFKKYLKLLKTALPGFNFNNHILLSATCMTPTVSLLRTLPLSWSGFAIKAGEGRIRELEFSYIKMD